ncbi:MAG: phytase [Saprospiraceae bacterium]
MIENNKGLVISDCRHVLNQIILRNRFSLFLYSFAVYIIVFLTACDHHKNAPSVEDVVPVVVTDKTPNDTDDPAIWYNYADPAQSLILGTDKGDSTGGIFVFHLDGKLDTALSLTHLARPNNIDVEYGFLFNGKEVDIAVFTERNRNMIRVIDLPACTFIDHGGIPVFEDDSLRAPMGIGIYKDKNNRFFAFVSRKTGPANGYLYQYELLNKEGYVTGTKVRALGHYSGKKEIEAVVVDDELGYVYYSDETMGVRKYYADAEKGNEELAFFATTGIAGDHEGLSIFKNNDGTGYIILSDQQANKFHLYTREGNNGNPNDHIEVRVVKAQTLESDGSDIWNMPFNATFPKGLFVAMSNDRNFQFYRAEDIIGK